MDKSKKIKWQAYDHIREPKSSDWFWFLGIIATAIIVLAIYFNNNLFALLVLIGTFTLFKTANNPPRILNYQINRKGVQVDETIYTYGTLQSFYVIDEDGFDRDRIIIRSKKILMPLIVIPLGENVHPEEIRDYLIEYLDEEEMQEPTIQRIMTIFGF